jgi:type VI secretion system protein ImpM
MMNGDNAPGFYGKLPCLGDFVTRRLPRSFIEPWDRWLQDSIIYSREQLAENWQRFYVISPMWRFFIAAGNCGPENWLGILMPSVDKGGRYFPLTLAQVVPATINPFSIIGAKCELTVWFEQAEEVLLSALHNEDMDLAHFDNSVTELELTVTDVDTYEIANVNKQYFDSKKSSAWRVPLTNVDSVNQTYPALLGRLIASHFKAYSVWWSNGSDFVDPSMLICEGLPPARRFAAMLGGEWRRWAWDDLSVVG